MKYTIQRIRAGAAAGQPEVLSSQPGVELPWDRLRSELRRSLAADLAESSKPSPPHRSAEAVRALDERGVEIDRWTFADEETARIIEDR